MYMAELQVDMLKYDDEGRLIYFLAQPYFRSHIGRLQ